MKSIKHALDQVVDYDNLYRAYLHARLCKRYRREVLQFTAHLEDNLTSLQSELRDGTYRLGRYREFYIYEPKKRLIMAQPFRDRVAQWAIYQVLHPLFVKSYITDSYACIQGRGTHKAVDRLHGWLREAARKPEKYYYLKLDISKFYYRIDHEVLRGILQRKIRDKPMLDLLYSIIENDKVKFGLPPGKNPGEVARNERVGDRGMPVGNLTSQMFANLYMDQLDQYCKRVLGIHYYIRYMDDVIILGDSKPKLNEWKKLINAFLQEKLKLDLNEKTCLRPITLGIEFCGYKVWSTHTKLRKSTALKMKRKLRFVQKRYACGEMTQERAMQTVNSYLGILKHCDSYALKRAIFGEYSEYGEILYEGWFKLQKDSEKIEALKKEKQEEDAAAE